MEYVIKRFVNKPVDSNTYILYREGAGECILIDPGSSDNEDIYSFLVEKNIVPFYILLTHEHFDHILGVNFFLEKYGSCVCCSKETFERIRSPKKNLSVFYSGESYEVVLYEKFKIWKENIYTLLDFKIQAILTPGHTDSSLSFLIDDKLFSGDFIIENLQTVTKLPTGSKKDLEESCEKIKKYKINKIFPGHGKEFTL
ncbi:putative metallo-hydrolase [Flavobacterium columnare]|uniref:MBL fold metallo-hydrolase n=2 Tax=Flavobacterium TaxID=237 RepID=A0ABW8PQ73_9FLAO|nr:MBL fold metallo-hydrolase [Flavobacterium columnare]SPE76858.1 putative metallo-hydrolase [Flavobacterium columnare]